MCYIAFPASIMSGGPGGFYRAQLLTSSLGDGEYGTHHTPKATSSLFAPKFLTRQGTYSITLVHGGGNRLAKTDLRSVASILASGCKQDIGVYVGDGRGCSSTNTKADAPEGWSTQGTSHL